MRSGILPLAHTSPDSVRDPRAGRGQYTTPEAGEKAPGTCTPGSPRGTHAACSGLGGGVLVVGQRIARPPSSAARSASPCVRKRRNTLQDIMGVPTTLLIHVAQTGHTHAPLADWRHHGLPAWRQCERLSGTSALRLLDGMGLRCFPIIARPGHARPPAPRVVGARPTSRERPPRTTVAVARVQSPSPPRGTQPESVPRSRQSRGCAAVP